MLFYSVFQGVHVGRMPYFPVSGKIPWSRGSHSKTNALFLHGNVEDGIRSLLFIFHVNYRPDSCTPLQWLTARTEMAMNENFSGKSPPGDFRTASFWFCGLMKLPYFLCASEQLPTSLTAFQPITLRQDTRCVISNITLRRHGLLQGLAWAWERSSLLFQMAQMKIAGTLPKAKSRTQMLGVRQRMRKPAG